MSLFAGSRLGPYEILALIGAGGMGEVYRAKDPRLGREVAIKVLPASFSADPDRLRRFDQEARAAGVLNHPNITAVYDVGTQDGAPYVVSELLEGETLRMALVRGPLPLKKAVEIGAALADGLGAAHSRGIVHRDIKPENIFLTSDARVKILDFGLAHQSPAHPSGGDTSFPTVSRTTPGTILGTVGYMSPEQALGKRADTRSDIFSLGCVLFELLTGERAFAGESVAEVLAAVLRDDPRSLGDGSARIPPDVRSIVRHCLEKNPEERYQTARDLAFGLRSLLSGTAPTPPRPVAVPPGVIDSLAVFPFENVGNNPDAEYLSEGIAESLTRALSQIPGLRVIARSFVARYRRDMDPSEAGRQLSVGALLTGRVVVRNERLSISAELVDVADSRQIWGQQYHRNLEDIFDLQERISAEIVDHLRPRLSGQLPPASMTTQAPKAEAYQLYLKGRYFWNRRPEEGFLSALDYFQKSIEADPSFALSYSGLADCYSTLGSWETGMLPPNEAFLKARSLARKALAMNDQSAEPHASMGYTLFHYDWDFRQAEQEFQRAIALNPGYAAAHHWYSHLLLPLGRAEESKAESLAALSSDPLDFIMNAHLAWHYFFAGNYDPAIEQSERLNTIIPNHFWSPFFGGLAYEQKGMLVEAIERFRQAVVRAPDRTYAEAALAHALALAGDRKPARQVLERLREDSKRRYVPAYDLAIVHFGLGETDDALALLERSFEERSSWLLHLKVEPRLRALHDHTTFRELVRRVGLPG